MQEISTENFYPNTLSDPGAMSEDEFREWECARENAKRVEPDKKYGIDCPICGNKGQVFYWDREEQIRRVRTCECEQARRSLRMLDRSGVCPDWNRKTLDAYRTPEGWQRTMKAKVAAYLADDQRGWLLVSGQSGCGKTHLCTAAFVTLVRQGMEGRYVTWSSLMQQMDAAQYKADDYNRLMTPLQTCRVLYLDDLFKVRNNSEIPNRAFSHTLRLLDARYQDPDLVTILSTEWTLERLLQTDEALAGRIVERCGKHIVQVAKAEGRNYRIHHT